MLVSLSVQNLAIIENLDLTFDGGFTALTGETGAGKSLLIDAVELALGSRADSHLVRSGKDKAIVQLVVVIKDREDIEKLLLELGTSLDEGQIKVVREVFSTGKSVCKVNQKVVPVSGLKNLGNYLVDLHGQHDHQALLNEESHLDYLDAWIGDSVFPLKNQVIELYESFTATKRKLDGVRHGKRDWERQLDTLRFQIEEIEKVAPVLGEYEELHQRLERLKHSERLSLGVSRALELFNGSDSSDSDSMKPAEETLGEGIASLTSIEKIDPKIGEILSPARDALYALQELGHELRKYLDDIEADPLVLEQTAQRLDSLSKLRRKYGDHESQVIAHLETAKRELEDLESFDGNEEALIELLDQLDSKLSAAAKKLSELRHFHGNPFSILVEKSLRDLAMDSAKFEVSFTQKNIDANGLDKMEFLFSANSGESMRPLAKIASGGELSRVMLSIKSALAGKAGVPTLVFDEVDTGLSGRAAAAVAAKLEELGKTYQVVVISHLPQIAARATHHFRIDKHVTNGRTVTTIEKLLTVERTIEIARMLTGSAVTKSSLENASELLLQR